MKFTFISIIILSFVFSSCLPKNSCVLIDDSNIKTSNPFKNQLDSLHQQPDSMEIFFLPQITPPKFYVLGSLPTDTIFLTYSNDSEGFQTH